MTLSDTQKVLIEARIANQQKSVGIAYLFLFITSIGHNFYLGRTKRGIFQLLAILCFGIGVFWVFYDVFALAGMVRANNQLLRDRLTLEVEAA